MLFTKNNLPPGYYVYLYLREDGTPYYCGKGYGNRAWVQHRKKNKGVWTPADNSRIVVAAYDLLEMGSFILERKFISWYGRKNNKTGILLNKTDGGEGVAGLVATTKTRSRMSASRKGKTFTDEHKQNMSIAQTGRKKTEEQKLKQANTMLNKFKTISSVRKGRTYEEIFGPEKAKELRAARSAAAKLQHKIS